MKSTLTLLTLSILFTVSSFATKSYEGYVVLNSDEKVEGTIQMLSPSLNEVKVKFTSKDGKKFTYKAKEVKEYGFQVKKWNRATRTHNENTIVYVRQEVERAPIAFGSTNVLIERQIAGTINMYNHFVELNSNPQNPFEHVIYVQKATGDLVSIDKSNYKVVLKRMTAEYTELSKKIGTKGHGFKHIAEIVNTYNTFMSGDNKDLALGMK